ncbi:MULTISPECIES: 3-hydroxyacyl-CoA dehydrogenase family protein [Amycolatopsis]|uniref:3-hydroxyacyl-CoA dehydrogenase family protein n=1 Tax=Amycolatopsis dendrobii TaxID=2760662 RepID=A0A7W3VV57_9PSEU|nr:MULTISPECIES: 3-hydroxyacyl-CoA dehydrogenase family protein [Amycolatopsis]MBB1153819.1 3-hydroxyacyl-CoA dehydrogenase family protein [Amycolatopsis dendrobii]UKD51730.1 3-hydroxyacyl-CoA dehydrogenase family protein [Amycolatopsis sp. FU40]
MSKDHTAHRLTILGAGVMGIGITALALGFGLPVTLVDVDETTLAAAREKVRQQLKLARIMGTLPDGAEPGELVTTVSLEEGAEATVVIEAVTELAEVKAAALAKVSALLSPGTPVVTNTSSIPVDELADSVARPEDFLGTHFMNPPYLIPMVEVIRGRRTGAAAEATLKSALQELGRTPLVVNDNPGFVTSRVLHPMINDAVRVVQEGTAPPETVDALFEGCLGHRTGPLRTADLIGLDNLADSLRVLYERTGDEGCKPNELLLRKVREGDLGRKSGRGFYEYGGQLS